MSVSTISPWVLVPILIFLFFASLVTFWFTVIVPSSFLVVVMVTSPFSPSFTTSVLPTSNVLSETYSVSNGISTLVVAGFLPIFIILGVGSFTVSTSILLSPSLKVPSCWKIPFLPFRVSWTKVIFSSPFWPAWVSLK